MYKIEAVFDTRSFNLETGKFEPGTGDPHSCDHCGKTHEVWCIITDGDERLTVGTTCAKQMVYDSSKITTAALKAAAIKRQLRVDAEAIAASLSWDSVTDLNKKVISMTQNHPYYSAVESEVYEVLNS